MLRIAGSANKRALIASNRIQRAYWASMISQFLINYLMNRYDHSDHLVLRGAARANIIAR